MVLRLQLTNIENLNIIVMKYINTSTIGYTLANGVYEISNFISMLKNFFQMI